MRAPHVPEFQGSPLYVGDLYRGLRALVQAHFEFGALTRHDAPAHIAEAVYDVAVGAGYLLDTGKWVQDQLSGIDWRPRPELDLAA